MNTLFAILFVLALIMLVASLIKPGTNKKTGKPFKRKDLGIGFGMAALVLAILAGVTTPNKPVKATVNPSVQTKQVSNTKQNTKPAQQTTTAMPAPQPKAPTITGYGATQSDWNANHQVDNRYDSGSVYNATPGLGLDTQHDDKYYAVLTQSGRILTYEMRLPNGSSLAAARAEIMQEFPSDATVVWQQTKDQCSQMEISSATLGNSSVLGSSDIGNPQGQVFVEFQTDSTSTENLNSYYDPSNVNLATVNLGSYNTATYAPGC